MKVLNLKWWQIILEICPPLTTADTFDDFDHREGIYHPCSFQQYQIHCEILQRVRTGPREADATPQCVSDHYQEAGSDLPPRGLIGIALNEQGITRNMLLNLR